MTAQTGFRAPPEVASLRDVVDIMKRMLIGGLNIGGSVTLTAGAASTTVTDPRVSGSSKIVLWPTSDTASLLTGVYTSSKAKGSFIVTHPDTADGTETYDYIAIG